MHDFSYLKADEVYAQYWFRESPTSKVIPSSPKKHSYRTVFACDRDRVMYCSAFRSLSFKTQVFNLQSIDGLRTRLTHTLEVSQIARTIAHELKLDEDLTEAIALGHDVGHTPFGHIGERTLNAFSKGADKKQRAEGVEISKKFYGFKHNLQSVRVLVEYSEGVKFSNFMLFGVREHSKLFWEEKSDVAFYDTYEPYCSYNNGKKDFPAWSFEAFVVKWADEIAQRHHDIEDAFLQKIMPPDEIVEKVKPLIGLINDEDLTKKFNRLNEEVERLNRREFTSFQYAFAHTLSSFLVDAYVTIFIKEFARILRHFSNVHKIKTAQDFQNAYLDLSLEEIRKAFDLKGTGIYKFDSTLGQSLKYSILDSYIVQRMDGKGAYIIRQLVRAYTSNPQQLPNEYIIRFVKTELVRCFTKDQINAFLTTIKKQLKGFSENISLWRDYECREVLRMITNDSTMSKKTYEPLLRTIFDYVASMTDKYATSQRIELY